MIVGSVSVIHKGRTDSDPAQGINRVIDAVTDIERTVKSELTPVLYQYVEDLAADRRARAYPPELPNQRYVRTFAMQEGYDMEPAGDNKAYYIQVVDDRRYVVDREWQAEIHQGRHETMQEDVETTLDELVEALRQAVLKQYD